MSLGWGWANGLALGERSGYGPGSGAAQGGGGWGALRSAAMTDEPQVVQGFWVDVASVGDDLNGLNRVAVLHGQLGARPISDLAAVPSAEAWTADPPAQFQHFYMLPDGARKLGELLVRASVAAAGLHLDRGDGQG